MKTGGVIGRGASGLAAGGAQEGGARSRRPPRRRTSWAGRPRCPASPGSAHDGLEDDTPELALSYLRELSLGDADDELLQVFAREAGPTAARVQRATPLGLQAIPYCDYHAERKGGRAQGGRTLEPMPYDPSPEVRALLRDAPNIEGPITYVELATGEINRDLLNERREKGTLTLGRALLAGLLQACLDAGVQVKTGARVRERPDADAVVLATGGFERDPELSRGFLRGPMLGPVGAPGSRGDGLRIAMAAGASLGCMSEAWWCPSISIPGETIDGTPMFRLILTERARPGSLIVDGSGRRFANEAQNYNDFGRTLQNFNPAQFAFPHVPAWLVFDSVYRTSYRLGPPLVRALGAGDAGSEERRAGTAWGYRTAPRKRPSSGSRASRGEDSDFGRGSYPYDRFIGRIGPLEDGPYYALKVIPGCLSTKGGPRTDSEGRVRSVDNGHPIPGLYAAGNVAASAFGMAYPGAGGTLGPALVFGLRAGDAAAAD
jgi:succinate dehydrogenase/fumarate reductase flavoprotein subunit